MTRVKICCISSVGESAVAVAHGASALGLVSEMPSGPGVIDEALITEIASSTPVGVATVLLTSQTSAEAIVAQQRRCRVDVLQLCEVVPPNDLRRLRDALPGVRLMHVVHVVDVGSVREAIEVAPLVDALLLDTGVRIGAVRELGGTGRTHDWGISRQIVDSVDRPVYLAGGLHAENVVAAITTVRPFGIDVCSGVRSQGRLDAGRLRAFMGAIATAFPASVAN